MADTATIRLRRDLVIVVVAFVIGGVLGALVAVAAVWSTRHRGALSPAAVALVLLALAAVLTVAPGLPDDAELAPSFARDREPAGVAALAAGVCAVVALGTAVIEERHATPRRRRRVGTEELRRLVTTAAPVAGIAAGALVVRLALAPEALRPEYDDLVASLRRGRGYPTGVYPPLPALLVAALPELSRVLLAITSTATVVASAVLGQRLSGRRGANCCGLLAAVAPWLWGQQLPEALAGFAVVLAVVLAWPATASPATASPATAAVAGACLGAATLARADALLALPLVLVWIAFSRPRPLRHVVPCAATAAVVIGPWLLTVHRRFGSWMPSTDLGASGHGLGSWVLPLATIAVGVLAARLWARRAAP